MTRNTIARRIALLSSSSLGLAAIASAASLSVVLAPSVALAQTATCTSGTAVTNNGSAAVTIAGGNPNNPGLTCVYTGDTATVRTLGTMTVSTVAPGGGINLSATGTDDVNWISTAGTITGGAQTNGPVIDAQTAAGTINLNTAGVTGSLATITHGIRAQSTSGQINIVSTGTVSATNSTSGQIGVEASTGGAGGISIETAVVNGRLYGITADAEGAGDLSIILNSQVSANASTGVAAVQAASGAGMLTITKNDRAAINGGAGAAIRTMAGGDALITINDGSVTNSSTATAAVFDLGVGAGTTTIDNIGGNIGQSDPRSWDRIAVAADGAGELVIDNSGSLHGAFDLSGFDGEFTFNARSEEAGWLTNGLNRLSEGSSTINNDAGSVMAFSTQMQLGGSINTPEFILTTLEFGDAEDVFNNAGTMIIGARAWSNNAEGATLTITGLEAFNNSGDIVLGTAVSGGSRVNRTSAILAGQTASDGHFDDVFVLHDSHFTGLEGSRVYLDALLNGTGQTDCSRNGGVLPEGVGTDPDSVRLVANDCLDFRGTQVSGQTAVHINDVLAGDRGAYNPRGNVFADVRGGVVDSPDVFVLAADVDGYTPIGNGAIDKGLFLYTIGYEAEQDGEGGVFKIYGLASATSQQFPLLAQAAGDVWRMGASSWSERRAEQLDSKDDGSLTGRTWLRLEAGKVERGAVNTLAAGDIPLVFDNGHTIDTKSLTVGLDLGRGHFAGGEWLVGAMFGYGRGEVGFDAFSNTGGIEGAHAGLYSGFTAGPFFQNLVIDVARLDLKNDVPVVGLVSGAACDPDPGTSVAPCVDVSERPILDTNVLVGGLSADTGWRFNAGSRVTLEPSFSLQWLNTQIDEMNVPADDPIRLGGEIHFDDARSLRAGLGLRVVLHDLAPNVVPLRLSLSAKSMQELEGDTTVRIVNVGPDAAVVDNTFDGRFNQFGATVVLGEDASHVNGFLSVGGVWADAYESRTASAGVRLQW